jgi:MFS family permease
VIRRRPILALLAAETVSSLGSQMSGLALPWFVLIETGSATLMGVVFAVGLLPMVVFGIPSGQIIARLGPRQTMLIADFARAPLIALVPALHALGLLSFPLLLVIVALHGTFSVTYFTSQRLLLPEVAGEDERSVAQGNALIEGATNLTSFLGPALAGVLIALIGAANVLWLDAASFALAFLLVATLVPARRARTAVTAARGMWAGVRYILADGLIGRAALSSVVYGFALRILFASLPVLAFVRFEQNPVVAGSLAAVWGAGAVAGSLLAYPLVTRIQPMRLGAAASIALALPLWLLVPELPLVAAGIALFVAAGAIPLMNAPYLTMLSTRVPAPLRGPVLQSVITINTLAGPLGYVVAGPLFDRAGLHSAYLLVAVLASLAAVNFVTALSAAGMLRREAAPEAVA